MVDRTRLLVWAWPATGADNTWFDRRNITWFDRLPEDALLSDIAMIEGNRRQLVASVSDLGLAAGTRYARFWRSGMRNDERTARRRCKSGAGKAAFA